MWLPLGVGHWHVDVWNLLTAAEQVNDGGRGAI